MFINVQKYTFFINSKQKSVFFLAYLNNNVIFASAYGYYRKITRLVFS